MNAIYNFLKGLNIIVYYSLGKLYSITHNLYNKITIR